ncbi:MAG: DM13 domain-containing protein [Candidatus Heimdallarchaeota archaeon]|nr:DM13 domain-containing protein [Candidatus Heimdallarchaeota archaeon]
MILGLLVAASVGWWLLSPLFLDGKTLNEELPDVESGEVTLLYTGTFVKIDDEHYGSGTAEIIQTAEGKIQLLFRDVDLANGPALFVYLSKKDSFSSSSDSAGSFKNLGELPAQKGNFSMNIIGVTNLDEFNSVLIWCKPFDVVFTFATLSPVS